MLWQEAPRLHVRASSKHVQHRRAFSENPGGKLSLNQLGYVVDAAGMLRDVADATALADRIDQLDDQKYEEVTTAIVSHVHNEIKSRFDFTKLMIPPKAVAEHPGCSDI